MRKTIDVDYNNLIGSGNVPDLNSLLTGDGLANVDDSVIAALPDSALVLSDQANVPTDIVSAVEVNGDLALAVGDQAIIDSGETGDDTLPSELIFVIDPIEISPDIPEFVIDDPLDLVEIIDDGSVGEVVGSDSGTEVPIDGTGGDVVDDSTIPTEIIDLGIPDIFIDDGVYIANVVEDPATSPLYVGENSNILIDPGIMIVDLFDIILIEDLTDMTTDGDVVGEVIEGNIDEIVDYGTADDGLIVDDAGTGDEPIEPIIDISIIDEPIDEVVVGDDGEEIPPELIDLIDQFIEYIDLSENTSEAETIDVGTDYAIDFVGIPCVLVSAEMIL